MLSAMRPMRTPDLVPEGECMELGQVVLDATTVAEIVQRLAEKLRANYVFPDVAEQICARLQYHLDDGAYAEIADGEFLAFALTTHL
jgi:hypothetical protein